MRRTLLAFALGCSLFTAHPALASTILPYGTVISTDTTWDTVGSPYVVSALSVLPGATLTIPAGVVVKMAQGGYLSVSGTLLMGQSGTVPTIVTSERDDSVGGDTNGDWEATTPRAGDWNNIRIEVGGVVRMENTLLSYGGGYNGHTLTAPLENNGGELFLASSTVQTPFLLGLLLHSGSTTITKSSLDAPQYTVYMEAGHFVASSTTFTSGTHGLFVGGGFATITESTIDLMRGYGLYALSATPVIAESNYWGDPSGPTTAANPGGVGSAVGGNVTFLPFLAEDPTIPQALPSCLTNCNSNIIFFPGIMGSRLFEESSECGIFNNEEERWVSKSDCEQARLVLDVSGKSVNPIYSKEGEDGVIDDAYSFNLYQSFMSDLEKWKTDERLITDYALVPYDWRLSLEDILQNGASTTGKLSYGTSQGFKDAYIYKTLKSLADSSRTKKVTIIAHSNGGLLTKALIQKLKDINDPLYDRIDKVIFVAVPQTGTPEAVSNILHGDQVGPLGFIMSTKRLRSLAQNMPSAYHLLPSSDYFASTGAHVNTTVVTFEDGKTTQQFIDKYSHNIATLDNLKNFLLGTDGRSVPEYEDVINPSVLSPSLFSDAENTQQKIGDSWTASSATEIYQIAGWGIPTLANIHYRNVSTCTSSWKGGCLAYSNELTFDPKEVIDGDGTVVEPSALAMSTSSEKVKRYWVNLLAYNEDNINREHKDILEVLNLRVFIKSIVKDSLTVPEYISASTPQYDGSDSRLSFTLHSPLSLEFTDSLGNHVGPSTNTPDTLDNFVPGARYARYGEVQLLSIPKTASGTLTLNGISDGSFTLDVEEVNGNDILSKTSFEGIPSATSTAVTMHIAPTQSVTASSTLAVDYDGDGATDFSLVSKDGEVVTLPPLDSTPPTTLASTTGTLGMNNWYTSSVTVQLIATDTDSGVASTTYSLDNGATWVAYTIPLTITTEGSTTILYYSTDATGNREAMSVLTLRIDKTAPEAMISVSTSTQDLLVEGKDILGTTTITKNTAGNYTLTDQAGHTTTLFFIKTYSGKRLTYAKLTGIQYDAGIKKSLPSSSFVYLWDIKTPTTLLSQTIAVDGTYLIQALFNKTKDKTTIVVLKKNIPIQTQTYTGLRIPKLTTIKGVFGYSL